MIENLKRQISRHRSDVTMSENGQSFEGQFQKIRISKNNNCFCNWFLSESDKETAMRCILTQYDKKRVIMQHHLHENSALAQINPNYRFYQLRLMNFLTKF